MLVSLIKGNKINNLVLPKNVYGNYWVTCFDENNVEQNLVNIEAINGKWQLNSNNDVVYLENNVEKENIILQEYGFYLLEIKAIKERVLLHCAPTFDKTYKYFYIVNNTEMSIGSDKNCIISYAHPLTSKHHATLFFKDNKFKIVDNKSKIGVFVNDVKINEQKVIESGDIIFIAGLKIIVLIENNKPMIIVNNPCNLLILKSMIFQERIASDIVKPNDYSKEEDFEMSLFSDDDYFHKKPRFKSAIETLNLNIDPPPAKQVEEEIPMFLTVAPMLTMGLPSIITGMTTLNNVSMGETTWDAAFPSLLICGAMLASMILWPFLTKLWNKAKKANRERIRQKKYSRYIDEIRKKIIETVKIQKKILNENFVSLEECEKIVVEQKMNLWERKITEDDFLTASLGIGTMPMDIKINYPEEHFSLDSDKMKDTLNKLINEPKELNDVPIPYSFYDKNITAVIGENSIAQRLVDNVLMQLMTFHSYDNLKIVVLTNSQHEDNWDYLKVSMHCFDDNKKFRFFGSNNDEIKEICYNLDRIYLNRTNPDNQNKIFDPYYLIITDCYKAIRNFDFMKHLLKDDNNYGFGLIIMNNKVSNLPNGCKSFINVSQTGCEVFENILNSNIQKFKIDFNSKYDLYNCCHILANIPIEVTTNNEGKLPEKIGFLEMYDVGKVEQLNSLNRWTKNNPILTLQAPIGIGKSGEKLSLDLHEKFHGPHGLIAGMTGSGKSEFIITYILSMAINYHPSEVQFILIDYKGGGLTNAFINSETGKKLPHIVGTITNLDANEINRSLASIESELKRRQRIFNEARKISNENTIDIYKYQNLYRKGIVKEPVSHLFIISDEFAELKQQQPDFMQQLISTARIGRSLGVHLILATQKPAGVVDNQIWSNTRFRVCLRVQDTSDSSDVIKCPDAAYLKQTGRFYLQVGYNEIFDLGQAAWAGNQYVKSEKMKKSLDTSLQFVNNIGFVVKNVETEQKEVVVSNGEELSNIVDYLIKIGTDQNIKTKQLWLERIPAYINVDMLFNKYDYKANNFYINPIIGEYDLPSEQEQKLLTLNFKDGNSIIFGAAGSGKENFIITMIYSSMKIYKPDEVNYYILDFGSESLKMFNTSPIVGDVITVDDNEKIDNLYKLLFNTIENRKDLFANYNGDFEYYCKNSGSKIPSIIIIINNFEAYEESYADYEEQLQQLTREGVKYGIYFVITVINSNGIRYKFRSNFTQVFALQQNSEADFSNILGNIKGNYPSKLFGRGLFKLNEFYEFQTAMVTEKDKITEFIKEKSRYYLNLYKTKAKPIPILPRIVSYNDISSALDTNKLIVGISKKDLSISKYSIYKNFINLIISQDISIMENFINSMIKQIEYFNTNNLIVINFEDLKINTLEYSKYYDEKFDIVFTELNDYFKENSYSNSKITCIIIGIEKFKSSLLDFNLNIEDLFNNSKKLNNINYIIIDSVDKIKKIEYDTWYRAYVNSSQGIWIGNGISEQFSLKISNVTKELRKEIPDNFCYVVKRGKPELVKYVENFEPTEIIEEI